MVGESNEIVESPDATLNTLNVASAEDAKQAMELYQQLCNSILVKYEDQVIEDGVIKTVSDYQRITTKYRNEKGLDVKVFKDFLKKSGWRKLARFYKIKVLRVGKEKTVNDDGSFEWEYEFDAVAPNGQTMPGSGTASSREFDRNGQNTRVSHDVKATAETRAINRCLSNLIGFGQVSAEEMAVGTRFADSEVVVKEVEDSPLLESVTKQSVTDELIALGVNIEALKITEKAKEVTIEKKGDLADDHFKAISEFIGANKGTLDTAKGYKWILKKTA